MVADGLPLEVVQLRFGHVGDLAAGRAQPQAQVGVFVVAHNVVGAEAAQRLEDVAPQAEQRAGDAGHEAEGLRRRVAARGAFAALPGWELLGCGAFFAYVRHPFGIASDALAQRLVREASILMLPGTMFGPTLAEGGNGAPERELRIAFANAGVDGIAEMGRRLAAVQYGPASISEDGLQATNLD